MLNSKKIVKIKSTIESKMSVPAGIRTHVLRLTVVMQQNFTPVINDIDVIFTEILMKKLIFSADISSSKNII